MKATGVVRRIDELGRIVIPKEIRNNLSIKQGENLEIFINDDSIFLKKYSTLNKYNEIANIITKVLSQFLNKEVLVTDMNNVISCNCKDIINKELSASFIKQIDKRIKQAGNNIIITSNMINKYYIISPIILNGDLLGSLVLLSDTNIKQEEEQLFDYTLKFFLEFIEQK